MVLVAPAGLCGTDGPWLFLLVLVAPLALVAPVASVATDGACGSVAP